MEIERKFLISQLPGDLSSYPCLKIQQGYLCTDPFSEDVTFNPKYHNSYLAFHKIP